MRRTLVLLACLALTGCSSSTRTDSSAIEQPTADATTSTSPRATALATTQPSPAATTTSAATAATTTQAPVSQPLTTRAPGKPAAGRATAAGIYTSDATGTFTISGAPNDAKGTATLTIGPVTDGRQHTTQHTDQGDTDQDLLVRDTGTYLAGLKVSPPIDKEFRPATAVLLLPDPAAVGTSWSWSATSTDGKTTASTTNKVVRTETLTIGGEQVVTAVLQAHLVLSGDVSYTADVTTWVATAYRLPVKDHTVSKGTYAGLPFSGDITTVVRSVHPA